jgi:hypothetical protein
MTTDPRNLAVLAITVCFSTLASAQVSGRFYLEKPNYSTGEPIFIYFEARNDSAQSRRFYSADPDGDCTAFSVKVSTDKTASAYSCPRAISCLSTYIDVMPREKHTERILLNYRHEITAGSNWVTVSRAPQVLGPLRAVKDMPVVSTTLTFHVDEGATLSKADYQPWVNQLNSPVANQRFEAARVLASVAPRSWEDLLLTFANNREFRTLAPLAFHRLATTRSNTALAALAEDPALSGTFEHWQAAAYLANDSCADSF